MATVNGTSSSLGRTRSARIPNNSAGRPVQPSSRGGTSGSAPSSHSTSYPTIASPTAPSNVTLFLTNLRLLDLDLHPDWPDINIHTFTAKDVAQGQKKRIQSVEWALYHLFALWDPDETRNKLRPFFPPLDQVQSLNLRAALLRCLEQAKKNGVLGRDAVVRKTMLDECKGERLEEVLAVFSSAVLKKFVAEQQLNGKCHPALAQTLALENRGYTGDRTELTVLVLAHRVSLRRILDERNAARKRFREFADLLASKEKDIARRRKEAEAARPSTGEQGDSGVPKMDVAGMLRNNWSGDERWMEALLYGDSKARKDGVLSAPFDRVWRRLQSGRLAELEDNPAGLLEQLDNRVRGQQERLEKWRDFRKKMFGRDGSEPAPKGPEVQPRQRGIDLGFRAHEKLHLGRPNSKLSAAKPRAVDSHYQALIDGLKSELANSSPAGPQIPSFFQRPRPIEQPPRGTTNHDEEEVEPEEVSDISDLEDLPVPTRPSPTRRDPIRVAAEPAFVPVMRKAKTFDEENDNNEPSTPSKFRRSATVQDDSTTSRGRSRSPGQPRPTTRPRPVARGRSPPRRARPLTRPANASPEPPSSLEEEERPISPTQELTDQILASVSAASPSPVKKPRHTLSLAERTRLSMARRTSHANLRVPHDEDGMVSFDDDNDDHNQPPEPGPGPEKPVAPAKSGGDPPQTAAADDSHNYTTTQHEDLAARTRRSMAGYEAARQKAQLERRRSLRKPAPAPATPQARGHFPTVDEDEAEGNGEGNNTTLLLAEALMNGEGKDDYEAVFRSRPKLKTSPVGTPVSGFWD
ncbi:hypothetical protein VTK26DRAFT_2578 [Humicola hyalothermophila]